MTTIYSDLTKKDLGVLQELLTKDLLIALPTETVYGLAGHAFHDRAIVKIYELKGRPSFNPLIIHFATADSAFNQVVASDTAHKLAEAFWPGPLTLVLPRKDSCQVSHLASAGLETLAVRVPGHPMALEILEYTKIPLAAPSANLSESISPTCAQDVIDNFGLADDRLGAIIDGGACDQGLESTILDLTSENPVILRPGVITRDMIRAVLGTEILSSDHLSLTIKAPGQMKRHYAPKIPLRINVKEVLPGEALLAFGPPLETHGFTMTLNLSQSRDLSEAAANLFAYLRALDQKAFRGIAVMSIPDEGIGVAINDRLRRAAAK